LRNLHSIQGEALHSCKNHINKLRIKQGPSIELSNLQLFVDAVHRGSFAAVARERNVDPSSVSRAIAALEDDLGIRLFQRSTRQLAPTEAGMLYFERIAPMLEEMQQACAAASDMSLQPKGVLRVSASVAFGLKGIVPLLPAFSAAYPDLTLELQLTDALVDLYAERIDVAVRLGAMADSSLVAQSLMQTSFVVCASPDYLARQGHPAHPDALVTGHNCLLFSHKGERTPWIFEDAKRRRSELLPSGRTVISNPLALQQCAVAGMGVALLSRWLVNEDLRAGRLVDVFPDYRVTTSDFNTGVWLVYPSRSYVPLKVRVFVDALKEALST
jgi:DNA-binding transcriptional LysR family regulator